MVHRIVISLVLTHKVATVKFNKLHIQPSIGYTSYGFDFAFSYRIGIMSYTSISAHIASTNINNSYDLQKIRGSSHAMSEPALTIRFGADKIKLQVQLGYSKDIQNVDFKYNQDNWNLNFGLYFSFS